MNGKDLYHGLIGDEMQMGPQVIDDGMEMVDRQSGAEAGRVENYWHAAGDQRCRP